MEQVLRGGLLAGGWIVGLFLMLSSCGSRKESVPSVEAQVLEAYEQYVLLLDNGISAKMVLELNGEQVSGAITKPTDADLEAFFVHYTRSEEHTSELQSRPHLVCRLLLEKKKKKKQNKHITKTHKNN